jgi:hypothetical protein
MCSLIGIFGCQPKTEKSDPIFEVFSGQGDRIEPIPFAVYKSTNNI